MRTPPVAALLAGALAAGLAALPSPASAAAGDPTLAFSSSRDGDSEIYLRAASGTVTQLTRNRASDYGPVWSPDGRRLAFVSDRDGDDDVYVMNADGTAVRQLTRNGKRPDGQPIADSAPAWSPDGRLLVFASNRDGGETEIYRMAADGTSQVRLTRTPAYVMDHAPSFSPGGHYVVFATNRHGYENAEIYRMRTNGTELRRLTTTGGTVDDGAPEYSPDGRRIAFSTTRSGGQQDVWVMNADGTSPRRLTGDARRDDVFPRWTADGRHVVHGNFTTDTIPGEAWVVAADGTGARRLTNGAKAEPVLDPRPPVR